MTDTAEAAAAPAQGSPSAAPVATETVATPPATSAAAPVEGQAAAPVAPAVVEYQPFSAPEGMTLEGPLLGDFTALAKANGWSQETAQSVINLLPSLQGQFATAAQTALAAQHDQQVATWKQETLAAKDIGAEGLAVAQTAIGRFLTPEAKAVLEATGLGDHPELVRSFMLIGKSISEGAHVTSGNPQEAPKTSAETRYNHPDSVANLKYG